MRSSSTFSPAFRNSALPARGLLGHTLAAAKAGGTRVSGHWNSYFTTREGLPASVMLDMSLRQDPPRAKFPLMTSVRIHMRAPREDGLSSQEEFDTLSDIFDALDKALAQGQGVCAGRINGNGAQDYVFYVAGRAAFEANVRQAMQAFPDYTFDIGGRDDPEWAVYLETLYPSPRDFQAMGNRDVCDGLERSGDDLQTPRLIDHCVYFADEVARRRFMKHMMAQGFRITDQFETESIPPAFGLVFSQLAVPAHIDDYQLPVFDDVVEFGGEYDGWETVIIKSPDTGGP